MHCGVPKIENTLWSEYTDHVPIELSLNILRHQLPKKVKPKTINKHEKRVRQLHRLTREDKDELASPVEKHPKMQEWYNKLCSATNNTEITIAQEVMEDYAQIINEQCYKDLDKPVKVGKPIIGSTRLTTLRKLKARLVDVLRILGSKLGQTSADEEHDINRHFDNAILQSSAEDIHGTLNALKGSPNRGDRKKYLTEIKTQIAVTSDNIKTEYKHAKNQYHEEWLKRIMDSKIANPKAFWDALSEKTNKRHISRIVTLDEDGTITVKYAPEALRQHIRNFWANEIYTSKFGPPNGGETLPWMSTPKKLNSDTQGKLVSPISMKELEDVMENMTDFKSPGYDGIPTEYVKRLEGGQRELVLHLFNIFFKHRHIPSSWKDSYITLIHKDGDIDNVANYRPIALLSVMYKLYTAILTRRLQTALREEKLLCPTQAGWQFNKQCFDNISTLMMLFEHSNRTKQNIHVLYLDIKKAYDSVEFWAIEEAMKYHGMPEHFRAVIMSLFDGTRGRIMTDSGDTEWFPITRGVRQGDVISPYLFLMFINPLLEYIQTGTKGYRVSQTKTSPSETLLTTAVSNLAFADDIALISDSYDEMKVMARVASDFFTHYGMELSATKSAYTEKCYDGQHHESPVLQGKYVPKLEPNQSYKYLGYWININLDWTLHIQNACRKYRRSVGRIISLPVPLDQRIQCINLVAIAGLKYYMSLVHFEDTVINELDVFTRKQVRRNLGDLTEVSNDMIYMARDDGGRELWCIKDEQHTTLLNTLLNYVFNNEESVAMPVLQTTLQQLTESLATPKWRISGRLDQVLKGNSKQVSKHTEGHYLLNLLYRACAHYGIQLQYLNDANRYYLHGTPVPVIEAMHNIKIHPKLKWNERILVFTDGSYDTKTKQAAFAIAVQGGKAYSQRVSGKQDVLLAELHAIECALKNLPKNTKIAIITDSMTSMKLLETAWENMPLSRQTKLTHRSTVLRIRELIQQREAAKCPAQFIHIYSHESEKEARSEDWVDKLKAKRQQLCEIMPDGRTL